MASINLLLFLTILNGKLANSSMQYGQNLSTPYNQQQTEHNNMFNNEHKDNILKTKLERDREDGKLINAPH